MHNYSLLTLLGIVAIGFPTFLSAEVANAADNEINEINVIRGIDYSDTSNLVFQPNYLDELSSGGDYFVVQIQSGSTIPVEPKNNIGQSNNTITSEVSTSTATNISANGGSPSTNTSPKSIPVKCEGSALCVTGEVVKVVNGKTFYINIQNKVYKVDLALIGLPLQSEEAMRAATIFTRNTCLGSNALIDQDDGQIVGSLIAQVYCSPTKHLNSLLLQTGYVSLDKLQCDVSEFSKLEWAKGYGC